VIAPLAGTLTNTASCTASTPDPIAGRKSNSKATGAASSRWHPRANGRTVATTADLQR
jgi:hypothetical protein